MHAHKRSLLIQAELGGVNFPTDEQYAKHKRQYKQDMGTLFCSIPRLMRCLIDCQIHLRDAVGVRHALELARSFAARVWDNSPYQMKQIAHIGSVATRKLVMGGISDIEALEAAEPQQIETIMSKNPPFGNRLLANLQDFPKLWISVKMMSKVKKSLILNERRLAEIDTIQELKKEHPITIRIKAECGFLNDKVPTFFNRKPVNICILTERSDGFLIDFRRLR